MPIDAKTVKQAAAGRWPDILAELGGIDAADLDGKGHPCPRCGGTDRFSMVDADAGAVLCRKCFARRNGDGLAALRWLCGWTLPESIDAVAGYLNVRGENGSGVYVTETSQNAGKSGVSYTGPKGKPPKRYKTRAAAVAAVARAVGRKPTAVWPYHDAAGDEVAAVARFDAADGGKTYRMVSRDGDGWAARGPDVPRPLYRLPDLADAQRVYLCEGEKACDAGRSVGLVCTTSPNGAQAPAKADWRPLAGKDVILCPDADEPGEAYIDAVGGILAALRPAPRVRVLRLPGLDTGDDLADYLDAHDAAEPDALRAMIDTLADAAPAWQPAAPANAAAVATAQPAASTPRLLTWRPFPTDALPEPVAGFLRAGAAAIGCDPAYIALPLLAGLASAIGNARRIELKHGWQEPPIIWAAVVAESGTHKSPAMELALRPIRARQRMAMQEHAADAADHAAAMLRFEKELTTWKRSKTDSDPPARPEEPTAARVWTDDATLEAMAWLLLANPRGLLCARDELAGWLGGFDRYTAGKGADAAKWLEVWGGRSIIIDRKTGSPRTIYVPRAAVSLCGCIQPGTLRRCLTPEHIESGMAARILFAAPPRTAKRWTENAIGWPAESAMEALFSRLYELEPATAGDGSPEPVALRLDRSAKECWVGFFNEHATEAAELSGELAAVWAKLEAGAARLALVVHLVRVAAGDTTADPTAVDAQSIAAGATLARWFGHEARRVYSMLTESPEDEARRGLVDLVGRLGGVITANDLRRRSRRFGSGEEAEAALSELVSVGLGTWEWARPGEAGGRPTRVFRLASREPVYETPGNPGNPEV